MSGTESPARQKLRRAYRLNFSYALVLAVVWGLSGSFVIGVACLHDLFDGALHFLNFKGEEWSHDPELSRRNCYVVPLMPGITSTGLAISVAPVIYFAGRDLNRHLSFHHPAITLTMACGDLVLNSLILVMLHGIDQAHAHSSWLHQIGDVVGSLLAIAAYAIILADGPLQSDPIAALVGALLVLGLCYHNAKEAWDDLEGHVGDHTHHHHPVLH